MNFALVSFLLLLWRPNRHCRLTQFLLLRKLRRQLSKAQTTSVLDTLSVRGDEA
jgi:hypothetical protein